MLVFVEGGKPENPEKNLRSKDENQQQTQPTYDSRPKSNRGHIGHGGRRLLSPLRHPCSPNYFLQQIQSGLKPTDLLLGVASGRAWISCVISSDDTNVSAFSFIPINDLIRGLPPGALSSRTADEGMVNRRCMEVSQKNEQSDLFLKKRLCCFCLKLSL